VYVEEQAKLDGHPLHVELVRRLRAAGAAGATVLRAVRGFYGEHEPFADRIVSVRRNVPLQIVVVDAPEAVGRWWPVIDQATRRDGLVTAQLVASPGHGPESARARR
jgi:PII-like signaling protein